MATTIPVAPSLRPPQRASIARVGDALRRHRRAIVATQWFVVVFYAAPVIVPATLPLPPAGADDRVEPDAVRAVCILGNLVAVRDREHDARRSRMVRAVVSRGNAFWRW